MPKIKKWIRRLTSGYYNYLLFFLLMLFVFRPYDVGIVYTAVWKTLLTFAVPLAIFNAKHNPTVRLLEIIFAIPALILSWIDLFYTIPLFVISSIVFTICFIWICACSILYDVVLRARVTLETLRGVVCAYFMIAFGFAYMYYLIEYIFPGSFNITYPSGDYIIYSVHLAKFMYFSFITLLTIGFGDIVPTQDVSQTFVIIEGIIGQFYIAILVARVVAVYSFFSDTRMIERLEKDLKK